jgi:hypothetical protein
MQNRAIWTLLHAREQSVLVPFLRGDAFFSRLEGDWWMRFAGEPSPEKGSEQLPENPLAKSARSISQRSRDPRSKPNQISTRVPSSITRLVGMLK